MYNLASREGRLDLKKQIKECEDKLEALRDELAASYPTPVGQVAGLLARNFTPGDLRRFVQENWPEVYRDLPKAILVPVDAEAVACALWDAGAVGIRGLLLRERPCRSAEVVAATEGWPPAQRRAV